MKTLLKAIKKLFPIVLIVLVIFSDQTVEAQTFQDNLTGEEQGEFPSRWDLIRGSAEVASLNGGSIIYLANKSIITPLINSKNYLSNNFTLEFDAFYDEASKIPIHQYYEVRFWEGHSHTILQDNKGGFYNPLNIYCNGGRIDGRVNGAKVKYDGYRESLKEANNVWRHIKVNFNNGAIKVFIDEMLLVNIPKIEFNPTMISIGVFTHEYADFIRAIKNVNLNGINNNSNTDIDTIGNNTTNGNTNWQTQDYDYALPTNDGTPNQILQTDGNGTVTWVDDTHPENNTSGVDTTTSSSEALKINDLLDGKTDTSGSSVFLGLNAGASDDGSNNKNVGLGFEALYKTIGRGNGNENVAIGYQSLYKNQYGSFNTVYGYQAGFSNIIGNANIFIGYQSGFFESRNSNKLYIENSDADANNALIYGEFDTDILRTNGEFQIGNPTNGGYAFPKVDGTNNQVLQTDGNGNMAWIDLPTASNDNTSTSGNTTTSKESTGLEAIDQGNGIGWRLIGKDSVSYGIIGRNAVDLSYSLLASTITYSLGATGGFSTAMGTYTTATGSASTAMGSYTAASGFASTAMGASTIASGLNSTAMGHATTASANSSTAMGTNTTASGRRSTAMGFYTTASGFKSTAMGGNTTASGSNSTAMGKQTKADSYVSTVIGQFNIGGGDSLNWRAIDPLFEIGNGKSVNNSNAFTVLKNGNIGIGTHIPQVKLHIEEGTDASLSTGGYLIIGDKQGVNLVFDNNEIMARKNVQASILYLQHEGGDVFVGGSVVHSSDRRLKKDIKPLAYGLNEILQLKPKAYNWKNRTQNHKSLGLIAQDVQPIINELVNKNDKDGMLNVNYTELIPILINAIQEQQAIIEQQKKENSQQSAKLEAQNKKIETHDKNYVELLKRVKQLEQVNNQ